MRHHARATVVPFPASGRARPPHGTTGRRATVVRPWAHGRTDARRNEVWDELLVLVERAWTWRDVESLEELHGRVLELGILVEADWA